VNLIGDHTDYTGGYVLPMAIDRSTVVELHPGGTEVRLASDHERGEAVVALDVDEPAAVDPPWARYVAGVVAVLRPHAGGTGTVRSTVPLGAGLSSSAALEVAVALALGFDGSPVELALACQEAEQRASGVPCGVMDQLASAAAVREHALLIDCTTLELTPVPLPAGAEIVVVHSGDSRALAGSAYAERRRQCEAAARVLGPLRLASQDDLAGIVDPVVRRRARHVITENERVLAFVECLRSGQLKSAGDLMAASHQSLRDDFEVSTPALDGLVARLQATPGVFGARLTGAGFGGCVVALAEIGTDVDGWRFSAAAGATVVRR
jgi:galactokinase